MEDWKPGDKFEVRDRDKVYLFAFGCAGVGTWLATNDDLKITVEGDTLAECREVALEAVQLIHEDMEDA